MSIKSRNKKNISIILKYFMYIDVYWLYCIYCIYIVWFVCVSSGNIWLTKNTYEQNMIKHDNV